MLLISWQTSFIPIILIMYFLAALLSKYRPVNQIALSVVILVLTYISYKYLASIPLAGMPVDNNHMMVSPLHRILGSLIFLGAAFIYLEKANIIEINLRLGALLYFVTTGFLFGTINAIFLLVIIALLYLVTKKRQIRHEWFFLIAIIINYLLFILLFYGRWLPI